MVSLTGRIPTIIPILVALAALYLVADKFHRVADRREHSGQKPSGGTRATVHEANEVAV